MLYSKLLGDPANTTVTDVVFKAVGRSCQHYSNWCCIQSCWRSCQHYSNWCCIQSCWEILPTLCIVTDVVYRAVGRYSTANTTVTDVLFRALCSKFSTDPDLPHPYNCSSVWIQIKVCASPRSEIVKMYTDHHSTLKVCIKVRVGHRILLRSFAFF